MRSAARVPDAGINPLGTSGFVGTVTGASVCDESLVGVKYERVYLHAYDSVIEARPSIMQYMDWYNQSRPHSSLDKQTPDEAYTVMLPTGKLAA